MLLVTYSTDGGPRRVGELRGDAAGVGASFTPQRFLWPGDVVEATVEGIGTLRNPVVDAR